MATAAGQFVTDFMMPLACMKAKSTVDASPEFDELPVRSVGHEDDEFVPHGGKAIVIKKGWNVSTKAQCVAARIATGGDYPANS